MFIPNATKDPRRECNPLVTEAPHLRAYAHALLKAAGGLSASQAQVALVAVRVGPALRPHG